VVSKALAPKELVKVYESNDKVVLPPWDPMVRDRTNLSRHPLLITCRVRSPDGLWAAQLPEAYGVSDVLCAFFFTPLYMACADLENLI
jgi:hypothetical protein